MRSGVTQDGGHVTPTLGIVHDNEQSPFESRERHRVGTGGVGYPRKKEISTCRRCVHARDGFSDS